MRFFIVSNNTPRKFGPRKPLSGGPFKGELTCASCMYMSASGATQPKTGPAREEVFGKYAASAYRWLEVARSRGILSLRAAAGCCTLLR
jgi:hypothetical protein